MYTSPFRISCLSRGLDSPKPEVTDPDKNEVASGLKVACLGMCMGFNDALNRQYVTAELIRLMNAYVSKRSVDTYKVTCDEANNPISVIQQDFVSVRVMWTKGSLNWMFEIGL